MGKINKIFIVLVLISCSSSTLSISTIYPSKEVKVKTAEAALGETNPKHFLRRFDRFTPTGSSWVKNCRQGCLPYYLMNWMKCKQGQVLIKLEDDELKAQLSQAQEALNQAQINLVNYREKFNQSQGTLQKRFCINRAIGDCSTGI